MTMYPLGDVPVLQLSLPTHDPDRLLELGRRLRPLRDEGVLVIGSGFMTHGLPFLSREHWGNGANPPGWSRDFDAWAAEALAKGDVDTLTRFASQAPGMPFAHPSVEHYTPLFVTLGAADRADAPVQTVIDGYFMGLSKRSLQAA
jgi:4,5-DOPA dioxygenase extradiol